MGRRNKKKKRKKKKNSQLNFEKQRREFRKVKHQAWSHASETQKKQNEKEKIEWRHPAETCGTEGAPLWSRSHMLILWKIKTFDCWGSQFPTVFCPDCLLFLKSQEVIFFSCVTYSWFVTLFPHKSDLCHIWSTFTIGNIERMCVPPVSL